MTEHLAFMDNKLWEGEYEIDLWLMTQIHQELKDKETVEAKMSYLREVLWLSGVKYIKPKRWTWCLQLRKWWLSAVFNLWNNTFFIFPEDSVNSKWSFHRITHMHYWDEVLDDDENLYVWFWVSGNERIISHIIRISPDGTQERLDLWLHWIHEKFQELVVFFGIGYEDRISMKDNSIH